MPAVQLAEGRATVISTAQHDRPTALGLDHGINYATDSSGERSKQRADPS